MLAAFLARRGFPLLASVTAEHLREWLGDLRSRGNMPSTVNTRYRAANAFFKWLVSEGERRERIRWQGSSRRGCRRRFSPTTRRNVSGSQLASPAAASRQFPAALKQQSAVSRRVDIEM